MSSQATILLNRSAVDRALGMFDPVQAVEDILREKFHKRVKLPSEATLYWSTGDGKKARSIGMPGALFEWSAYGMKVINASLANTAKGLARASGVVLLFDPETARIKAVIDAARISAVRTGLMSFVAAKRLATLKPLRLGVIGCGPIGFTHIEIFIANAEVAKLILYDINSARIADAIKIVRGWGFHGEIEAASSVATLFTKANCIVTATTVTEPYIGRDVLKPGQTLINVSLDDVAEEAFCEADQVWVDDLNLVMDDERRLLGKMLRAQNEGHTSRSLLLAGSIDELVAADRIGRIHKDEIIIFNPFGMGLLDVGIASLILREAENRQHGSLFAFEA